MTEVTLLTSNIETNYPDLYRYLDENPISIPADDHPTINDEAMLKYLNSLKELLKSYIETHRQINRTKMPNISEKGGGSFKGIRLLLCENPLPPIDNAIEAARQQLAQSNFYTEAFSAPLRKVISEQLHISEKNIHINAGSELILRQLFLKFGQQVHLVTPTYSLFTEIGGNYTETVLKPETNFQLHLEDITIPNGTTLFVIVNPNNPTGTVFNMTSLARLLEKHPQIMFLVDEAFIGVAGNSVVHLVPQHNNLIVTRTLSKAHSLAGFRIGYALLPESAAKEMNQQNDAYPLARPSEAAAIATLQHEDQVKGRIGQLKSWTQNLSAAFNDIGIRTYPSETYFFLADFSPLKASKLADDLCKMGFLVKALTDPLLGDGFMRITTSTPQNNELFIKALKKLVKK